MLDIIPLRCQRFLTIHYNLFSDPWESGFLCTWSVLCDSRGY